ncbi:glycosyl hydrolase family 95 catalytic domain-containing protein [Ruminiclostridium papyrosolvens]|uniref:cellulase n=1 Tax=Ruminiclostridium papyrosolvens C7 TaxID=1330534 RepID=U4QZE0_9FIRM|nr:glycoside hydrolase N-terminal domain-containing protein [Ruminiclostridium papyrosolvens]EPR09375.1 sugar-binding protein [Ruminiclostridium papyrosolvens C7]
MKINKKFIRRFGATILAGVLITSGNLPFSGYKSMAATQDTVQTEEVITQDNDLKLLYNTMAGSNFSGDPYDINESFYKALPLGNGRIGAMVYGNYPDERIDLNEATFWSSGPGNNNRTGAANSLKTAQDQLFAGQYKTGSTTIANNMIGGGEAKYQSIGDLKLSFGHSSVSDYSRQLDMNTGVVSSDYTYNGKKYHRESFVSYPDQIMVTKITCSSPGSISLTAGYESSLTGQYTVSTSGNDTLIMNGHGDSDNGISYAVWFSTRSKIINTNGSVSANNNQISVINADSVVILTSIRTNFVNYKTCNGDEKGKATTDITNALTKSYNTLYNNHVADYQNLFKRVDVDLGGSGSENSKPMGQRISEFGTTNDPKLAKVLFQYGRYLMISASRDSQPMNLQGIWNKFRNPAWGCKMTTNINYEMNYWPAFTTNLAECFKPFVAKAKELQAPGNETARAHYNISNGWVLHHNTDLWNRTAPIDGEWGFWPTGAGWVSNMLYDAYNFNQDTAYLNEIYPVIKGAADFLQTLMQSKSINGQNYQVICPGTSPELTPPSTSGGQGAYNSYGVTMDNGISRELFKDVIQAAGILNVDSTFRSTLQSKVSQIKPDTIGSWGQLQEWAYDWDSQSEKNRHISLAYDLFPGLEINKRNTPSIANAVIKSLNTRGDVGTGWSEAWKLNCWARLEDGAHAYNLVKLLITPVNKDGRLYDNLWDAHPPFQIDGNFGFTSGIAEMLLQSHNNEIQLLPALPSQWSTGHADGLCARGNFTVTKMNWENGVLTGATIKSNSGNVCNVRYGNKTISFPTKKGYTYQLDGSLRLVESGTVLTNVALNKTATASGSNSGEEGGKAVDGSTTSKWCHDNGISGEWLQVDLGAKYDISRWVVKHCGVAEAIRFNTRDFTLQKSDDGTTWTDVDVVYGNQQNITDRNVPTFNSRYVRLYINTATQDNSGGARITELELWGKPSVDIPKSAFSQIEAEEFSSQYGVQAETCSEGGQDVAFIENEDFAVYSNIDFGEGAQSFQARVSSATSGGKIEIRLDSIDGPLVGTCPVMGTGDWQNWSDITCNVNGASGKHDLYLKFTGDSGYLFNLNWFKFSNAPIVTGKPGDINNDGEIDAIDLLLLKKYLLGLETIENSELADLDANGEINAIDFSLLKKYLLGTI